MSHSVQRVGLLNFFVLLHLCSFYFICFESFARCLRGLDDPRRCIFIGPKCAHANLPYLNGSSDFKRARLFTSIYGDCLAFWNVQGILDNESKGRVPRETRDRRFRPLFRAFRSAVSNAPHYDFGAVDREGLGVAQLFVPIVGVQDGHNLTTGACRDLAG